MYKLDNVKLLKEIKRIVEPRVATYIYIREPGSRAPWRLYFENRPSARQFRVLATFRARGCRVSFWRP